MPSRFGQRFRPMNSKVSETGAAFGGSLRRTSGCWFRFLFGIGSALVLWCAVLNAAPADGAKSKPKSAQLAEMSIEQLVDVEVVSLTSLFKKETKLEQAPAAAAIVSSDDVRRMGVTTLPEALRMVPGMNVGRIDSHEWAVSARGFNAQFANKLLILVDGRTIYGPAYGGVNWGMQ